MRIAILTPDGAHHQCFISLLTAEFELTGAVIEPDAEQCRQLWIDIDAVSRSVFD